MALAVSACVLGALMWASPAQAGRLLATGHDADSHCAHADEPQGQCHFVAVAVNYVRGAAPNPARPLLLLDCSPTNGLAAAVNTALGAPIPSTTICPRADPAFKTEPLTTSRYSAIIVGSSPDFVNINRPTTTPDSTVINARKGDIAAFFNAGGGVLAFSGDISGDGDPATRETYYELMPIPIGGRQGSAPFTLTPDGIALGFQDSTQGIGTGNDINCCPTHNSFQEPPAGSSLRVAERDSNGAPETLFGEGLASSTTIVPGVDTGAIIKAPSTGRCTRRKRIKIRIRQPAGSSVRRAVVYLNGKRVKTLRRRSFRGKRSVAVVLRKLPKRTARVRIVVRTTQGVTHKRSLKYRICKKRASSRSKI